MFSVTGGEKADRNSFKIYLNLIIKARVISSPLYNWELWLGVNQYIKYSFSLTKEVFY